MKLLIDECIDERFRNYFPTHECHTVRFAGFAGVKNGELLSGAESRRYEVLLTVDQGLGFQQNLPHRKIAVIILRTGSTRLKELVLHVPACLACLSFIKSGEIVTIPGKKRSS